MIKIIIYLKISEIGDSQIDFILKIIRYFNVAKNVNNVLNNYINRMFNYLILIMSIGY